MARQQYTLEFKRRAVALLFESDKSVTRVTQQPDTKENTLHNWKNAVSDFELLFLPRDTAISSGI
ncbi:transposase [Brenneria uluponensis]|uniref:transposase n=1 Tax=Brenneria uluponensis TaxID=3057057 RepID=UPI0028EC7057|nr:transposase [Brenneria ulupoensis]